MSEAKNLRNGMEVAEQVFSRAARTVIALGLSASGGVVAMNSFGQTHDHVGPIEVNVGLEAHPSGHWTTPLNGGTRVGVGDAYISYPTHRIGPSIIVTPTDVRVTRFEQQLLAGGSKGESKPRSVRQAALADIERIDGNRTEIAAKSLGMFLLGAGGVGGALFVYSPRRRGGKLAWEPIVGSATAAAVLLGSAGAGYATRNSNALLEPHMHGAVAEAYETARSVSGIREITDKTATNAIGVLSLADVLQKYGSDQADIAASTRHLLLVADPHDTDVTNTVRIEQQRHEQRDETLDAMIVAGDETNIGSDFENRLIGADRVAKELGIDSYRIPGNHDTDQTMRYLSSLAHTQTVEKGKLASWDIGGLRVLAVGDPNYTPNEGVEAGAASKDEIDALRQDIVDATTIAADADQPFDMVVTHEYDLLDGLELPVDGIVTGHTHKFEMENEAGKPWHLTLGSISGGGLRADQNADGEVTTMEYALADFDKSCQLIGIESVASSPFGSDATFSVTRVFNQNYDSTRASSSERCE